MNFLLYAGRHRDWSERTFGPATPENDRTPGVLDHLRKEIGEVERAPTDAFEWADLIILAIDGAWRNGVSADDLCEALELKQKRNAARSWPDWRTAPRDKAIEHHR